MVKTISDLLSHLDNLHLLLHCTINIVVVVVKLHFGLFTKHNFLFNLNYTENSLLRHLLLN